MSIPQNPLNLGGSTTHRHMLIAFKYASDAFNLVKFDPIKVDVGQSLPDVGPNVVVVNEFGDQKFSIPEAMWDFDYIPNIGVSTTSSVGKIVIADRYVPYSFINFLKYKVLAKFNELEASDGTDEQTDDELVDDTKFLMSLGHATFVLKTFFTLEDDNIDSFDGDPKVISINPFYFNIDSLESVPSGSSIAPVSHIIHAIGAANTTGLLRSFGSIFQMNITHKDGNIHDTIPAGTGSNGLKTRSAENTANAAKRKERLDLSKPMLTLKDVFEGFEADLNQQKFANKAQLQYWRRVIRNDKQPDKIVIDPKQTKLPKREELPMDFVIDLDPLYAKYKIDNRNMPFEQPSIAQTEDGIRVLPIRPGAHIFQVVESLMLLSKEVGDDAVNPLLKKTFKTTITAKRSSERYTIYIKIRQYILPSNGETANTGPGVNTSDTPLHFFVNDALDRDVDVMEFKSHINYQVGDTMLEIQTTDNVGAGIIYADREQATAERRPDLPFYQTLYSGVRPMIASYGIDGLESAQKAGNIFNLMDRYTYTQTTDYELLIMGNPYLLSDLNRNPNDVISDSVGNGVHYYSRPEVDPMYVKVTIFESSYDADVDGNGQAVQERFYFDNYYHVTRVVNMFGVVGNGGFYQKLLLKRSDTLI